MSLSASHVKSLEKKYAFKPIPHTYPFDPRVPVLVDSVRGDQPIFVLCKNRQEVVIEGPFITDLLPKPDPQDEFFKYHWVIATLKYSAHVLEIIVRAICSNTSKATVLTKENFIVSEDSSKT